MKLKIKFAVYYIITFLVFAFNIGFFVSDQLFFKMSDLPAAKDGEEPVYSALSPDLTKSAECYTVTTPEGTAVRVELVTYDEDINVKERENIYWEVGKDSVIIGWVDENNITIDSRTLNLSENETYDSRRVTSN